MEAAVAKERDIVGVTSDWAQNSPLTLYFAWFYSFFCFNVIRSAHFVSFYLAYASASFRKCTKKIIYAEKPLTLFFLSRLIYIYSLHS